MIRYAFLILIVLHGAIHLLGFVKGFQLAEVQNLQFHISKTSGLLWLLTCILLILSAVLYFYNNNAWMYLAAVGIVVSSILIVQNWNDAKFGMIPNFIIAMALLVSFCGCAFDMKISKETQAILAKSGKSTSKAVTKEDLTYLPAAVQNWLMTSGAVGKPIPKTVWLRQNFKMKLKPEQENWYEAIAEQYFTTENPAFIWTVDLNMLSFLKIKGRDKFVDGKGEMQMKMNSIINLGKETGEKMDEGTLQRYLGEMVWFPPAALKSYVAWEEIDALTAKATMTYQGTTGSGVFYFNKDGDCIQFSALRYKGNDPDAKRHEWIITVDEYAEFEGIKIPSKCQATWKLDEGDWTWCVLEITDLSYDIRHSIKEMNLFHK